MLSTVLTWRAFSPRLLLGEYSERFIYKPHPQTSLWLIFQQASFQVPGHLDNPMSHGIYISTPFSFWAKCTNRYTAWSSARGWAFSSSQSWGSPQNETTSLQPVLLGKASILWLVICKPGPNGLLPQLMTSRDSFCSTVLKPYFGIERKEQNDRKRDHKFHIFVQTIYFCLQDLS